MHGTLPQLKLLPAKASRKTVVGNTQCDQRNRDKNERVAAEMSAARDKLAMRFLPFIWLEDQNLGPVALMETVAERLWVTAQKERQRRKTVHRNMYEQ